MNPALHAHLEDATWASISTSTRCSGRARATTCTIVATGRTASKISLCARPTSSKSAMSVTYIRVRTTCCVSMPAVAEGRQRDAERDPGLLVRIADADDLTLDRRGRAGDPGAVADPDGAGVADDVLER